MKLMQRLKKYRDLAGKDAQLRAFERFSLCLDAENEITVCGCESILDYSEDHMRFRCCDRDLEIWGPSIMITVYDERELRVEGAVERILIKERKDVKEESSIV